MLMLNNPVQFFTTGFGDWRRVLPAGPVRDFYLQTYPRGRLWESLPTPMLGPCRTWIECDLARADGDRVTPTIPVLTRHDRDTLRPWFDALATHTVAGVSDALPAFRRLAERYSDRRNAAEHILTILILWSINMWVLRRLLVGPMGRPPPHGDTGRYFIWGEELGQGPNFITGIRVNRGTSGFGLCVIVSRIVDRPGLKDSRQLYARVHGVSAVDLLAELAAHPANIPELAERFQVGAATLHTWMDEQRRVRVVTDDEPPRVGVPVFVPEAMAHVAPACDAVARRIISWLQADTTLEPLVARCSFAHYPPPPGLCMLWHYSYYVATDRLISQGVIPAFPAVAEGDWGVWLTADPYGRAHTPAAHPC
jgi:hypothetical protein